MELDGPERTPDTGHRIEQPLWYFSCRGSVVLWSKHLTKFMAVRTVAHNWSCVMAGKVRFLVAQTGRKTNQKGNA